MATPVSQALAAEQVTQEECSFGLHSAWLKGGRAGTEGVSVPKPSLALAACLAFLLQAAHLPESEDGFFPEVTIPLPSDQPASCSLPVGSCK